MLGEIVYTPDSFIAEQLVTLRSVLDSVKSNDKIFLPPIPRFAFGGCCENTSHAPNTSLPTHSTFALTEHIRQRNCITKNITAANTKSFKVLDILGTLAPAQHNVPDKAVALKKLTLRDNVHLSEKGYALLAEKIIELAKELKSRQTSPSGHPQQKEDPLSGRELQTWGGFFVTVGCGRRSVFKAPVKKGPRAHPYRR